MKAIEMIEQHNASIENYINGELAKILGAKDGMISVEKWFEAQRLINEQCFYQKGMAILTELRAQGYDVKMDMQSNKLILR